MDKLAEVNVEAAKNAASQLKAQQQEWERAFAANEETRQKLLARKAYFYRLPLPKEEQLGLILASINAEAAAFPKLANWSGLFGLIFSPSGPRPCADGPLDLDPNHFVKHRARTSLQDIESRPPVFSPHGQALARLAGLPPGVDFFHGLNVGAETPELASARACFFFGDVIKARVAEAFERHWTEPPYPAQTGNGGKGMSSEQRMREIEKCDEAIAVIDAWIERNSEQLADVPGFRKEPNFAGDMTFANSVRARSLGQ